MASPNKHSRACRRLRVTLIRELPEPRTLLDSPELRGKFSDHERSQILSPQQLSDRTEELTNTMEWASQELFQALLAVLKRLKPGLAAKLEEEIERKETDGGAAFNANGPVNSQSPPCM